MRTGAPRSECGKFFTRAPKYVHAPSGNSVIVDDISQNAHSSEISEGVSLAFRPATLIAMPRKVVSIADGFHKTGSIVPNSGIYSVRHKPHLLPSEITLMQGEVFPRCEACEEEVHFRLIRKLVERDPIFRFRVQLYQLPVLEQPERKTG